MMLLIMTWRRGKQIMLMQKTRRTEVPLEALLAEP